MTSKAKMRLKKPRIEPKGECTFNRIETKFVYIRESIMAIFGTTNNKTFFRTDLSLLIM